MPLDTSQELRHALARYVGLGVDTKGVEFVWKVVEAVAPLAFEIYNNAGNGYVKITVGNKRLERVEWHQSRLF